MLAPAFDIHNPHTGGPVIIAVPHAGRDHPSLAGRLRVPLATLLPLEDRYADRLAEGAIAAGVTVLVARTPRLWIDLNRDETDVDPAMFAGPVRSAVPLSARVRGGLGLVPRRLGTQGEIWRAPIPAFELAQRIGAHHRPWHDALSQMLTSARAHHGAAILIDLHSMPPLEGIDAAQVVIGDRFGRSAEPGLVALAHGHFEAAGLRVARNTPYAGGHSLDRHGRPAAAIHALQIEIDRRCYLDDALDLPGPGLDRMTALIAELATRLTAKYAAPIAIAAE